MFSFFSRSAAKPKPTLSTAAIPDGIRAYVVGDIHGRLDLLRTLHGKIRQDSETARGDLIVVYIGDDLVTIDALEGALGVQFAGGAAPSGGSPRPGPVALVPAGS